MNNARQARLFARQGKDCDDCKWFIEGGYCTKVAGHIDLEGISAFFQAGEHRPKGTNPGKMSKAAAGYFIPSAHPEKAEGE